MIVLRLFSILFLGCITGSAQTLNIKGSFVDTGRNKQEARYTLVSDDSTICEGSAKKIRLALALNQNYILTVSSEGFISKSIRFSTHTSSSKNFDFEFTVVLQRESLHKMNHSGSYERGHVFFDQRKNDFNYKRH